MPECTPLERAFLDALHAGEEVSAARVRVTVERMRATKAELIVEYVQAKEARRAADVRFRSASDALWKAVGVVGETGARIVQELTSLTSNPTAPAEPDE